jgi:hypothetical protein
LNRHGGASFQEEHREHRKHHASAAETVEHRRGGDTDKDTGERHGRQ